MEDEDVDEQSSVLLGSVQRLGVLCLEDEDVDEAMDNFQRTELIQFCLY